MDDKLQKRCNISFCSEGNFKSKKKMYQRIDAQVIKNGDYESIIRMLQIGSKELCLEEIIVQQVAAASEVKGLYMLPTVSDVEREHSSSSTSIIETEEALLNLYRFVSIKVKQ